MNRANYLQRLGLMCGVGLLLSGCLFKAGRVPTRQFVLASVPAPEHASPAAPPLSVEVGFVKMPPYLLRDAMVVRKNANEFEYLENALWAERLDQGFQRVLSDDLASLLASEQVSLSASGPNRVVMRVSVRVEQFDVDTQGRGTLLAGWRLTFPGSDRPPKDGQSRLTQSGPSPRNNPQIIATTLSALTTQFSQALAQALRDSAPAKR